MNNVLLVGSGAREVAIAKKIKKSRGPLSLFCIAPSTNPQIKPLTVSCFERSLRDVDEVVSLAKKLSIDIAIVGPENPLEIGLVDALEEGGISVSYTSDAADDMQCVASGGRRIIKKKNIAVNITP